MMDAGVRMSIRTQEQEKAGPPVHPLAASRGLLHRNCACGGATGGHKCSTCGDGRSLNAVVPPIVSDVLNSSGQSLDPVTRSDMEARFGHDFSRVMVHSDERAAESAQSIKARAYTYGRDVVFGPGQYAPNTTAGKQLLAHEL